MVFFKEMFKVTKIHHREQSLWGEAALWYWAMQMHTVSTVGDSSKHREMYPVSLKLITITLLIPNIVKDCWDGWQRMKTNTLNSDVKLVLPNWSTKQFMIEKPFACQEKQKHQQDKTFPKLHLYILCIISCTFPQNNCRNMLNAPNSHAYSCPYFYTLIFFHNICLIKVFQMLSLPYI